LQSRCTSNIKLTKKGSHFGHAIDDTLGEEDEDKDLVNYSYTGRPPAVVRTPFFNRNGSARPSWLALSMRYEDE
jgi:hypothetical protein